MRDYCDKYYSKLGCNSECPLIDVVDCNSYKRALEDIKPLLDLLVQLDLDIPCDELCGSEYCENCQYDCPQEECYLMYARSKRYGYQRN